MERPERKLNTQHFLEKSTIAQEIAGKQRDLSIRFSQKLQTKSSEYSGDFINDFYQNKEIFEQNMVIYAHRTLDFLSALKEGDNVDIKNDIVFFFLGRSGLTLDLFIREAVREKFGSTPLSIRLPTESGILTDDNNAKGIRSSWVEGQKYMPLVNRPPGVFENWRRDWIHTPHLDRLLKNKHRYALIFDTVKVGGRSLEQAIFSIKPYRFDQFVFISVRLMDDYTAPGRSVCSRANVL